MQPTGTTRPLQYPLNRTEDIESETPNDPISFVDLSGWATTDSEERIRIVMDLSLNEYVALATAIDVGRDIAYGDNSLYIWWIWVRGLVSMSICSDVADCIQNDPSVFQALTQVINGTPESVPFQSNLTFEPVTGDGCDNDTIYGYCKGLWQYIDANNIDFLEDMAEQGNFANQIKIFIDSTGVGKLLPTQAVLDWVNSFANYNLEAYNASKTVAVEQQIICDLFCIAVENDCHLTMDQVWEYFVEKFGGFNLPTLAGTFLDWVVFMATGIYPTDRVIYLWCLFQLAVVFMDVRFRDVDHLQQYQMFALAGDPDNEWSLLCDPCNDEWTSVIDWSEQGDWFLVGASGFTPATRGVFSLPFVDDTDQYDTVNNRSIRGVDIAIDITQSFIKSIKWRWNATAGTFSAGNLPTRSIVKDGATDYSVTIANPITTGSNVEYTHNVDELVDYIEFRTSVCNNTGNNQFDGGFRLIDVVITGAGVKPPELP